MIPAVVDPSGLQRFCDRVVDGIAAVFLALKRRPVIRYQRTSDVAKRIAHETSVSKIAYCKKMFSNKLAVLLLVWNSFTLWKCCVMAFHSFSLDSTTELCSYICRLITCLNEL